MSGLRYLAVAIVLGACGTGPVTDTQSAKLASVSYEMPVSWQHTDSKSPRGPTSTWLPEENVRKESLIVTRANLERGRDEYSLTDLQDLLVSAQHKLPHSQITRTELFKTPSGLQGVRIEASFVPAGAKTYYRSHAVLLDGKNLIHVMYTAEQPDEERSFDIVVGSIREEG